MANKKNTITNAQALAAAHDLAGQAGMIELANKLAHMYEQATKKRDGKKKPTKQQIMTRNQASEIRDIMRNTDIASIDTKWVMSHINYVTSPQKATAIMKAGIALGYFAKGEPVKGRVTYVLADAN